jgi:integral membrane sensor domain MASE1
MDAHALVIGALLFAGYCLGAQLEFALRFQSHPIAVLWPPNGILLAFLLLTPKRHWWLLVLVTMLHTG